MVILATAAACSSAPPTLGPVGGGADAGDAAGSDASGDGSDASTDAGVPDASDPGDLLVAMCGSTPATPQDWEHCRAKRFCETHVRCSEQNLYTSPQECIELSDALSGGAIEFDIFEKARAVAAGRAAINVAAFTQCLVDFSPQQCSTAATAPSCPTRYTGTVADGQACFNDAECISPGARCEPTDCGASCCTGTCTPLQKLGQPCHDFGACEPGLVCSVTTQKCVTGDVGTACGRYDCDAGNWCNNGTCKPDVAEGAPCNSLLQCGGETTCVGTMRLVAPATCRHVTSVGDACDWFCLGNLYCDLSNPDGFGVCRSLPTLDETCSFLRPCIGQNLRCSDPDQGVCIPRTGLGQPCTDGTCLPGLFCTDQLGAAKPVCRAPFADDETGCMQDAQCRSHICTGDQATAGKCLAVEPICR
ncbi:MAG: hypothetical protein E6J90_23630 [Deltaproteobacteria bacterium]|nr:MAG: hypothetical protein E6J90_23630 [Deltaproteobacteria bacterium]